MEIPAIKGCKDCGVTDEIARWWPEAYRALATRLSAAKNEELGQ